MNHLLRRTIAIVGGLVVFAATTAWAFRGGHFLSSHMSAYAVPSEAGSVPIIHMQQSIDGYAVWSMIHLTLAASISFGVLVWNGRPSRRSALIIYALMLSFVMPFSALNFSTGAYYAPRSQQFIIDLILVVLGIICVQAWRQLRFSEVAERAVHSLVLFIIVAQSIALPATYAVIWWLDWQGLGIPSASDSGWLSALVAIAALVITVLDLKVGKIESTSGSGGENHS